MQLLQKSENSTGNVRQDNADKLPLFAADSRPSTAAEHREAWGLILDTGLRENISYQMQYWSYSNGDTSNINPKSVV
jgi:hypothetical protein